ncbi:MAG: diaminopimelate decarboxylase [Pseudomonadota bacterium]
MNHFCYRDGILAAEEVPIPRIAEAVGTPFYCYSTATLTRHYRVFAEAFAGCDAMICYAVKANSNQAVLRTLADLGAGADVVSGGELRRALAAKIPGRRIVFSGVGKTREEMALALDAKILQFNVESEAELEALSAVAAERGERAPVAIRINPDIDSGSHAKIATGRRTDKFGIAWERVEGVYDQAAALPGIEIVGIAVHIGSQLLDLAPFQAAFAKVAGLVGTLRAKGHPIERCDLGGGLGVPYNRENPPDPMAYAAIVRETTQPLGCKVILEPGRLIAGNAGILVTKALYLKESTGRHFVIVDAAMNDLLRSALYDAFHRIEPVVEPATGSKEAPVDIVGPVCESGDRFASERPLPPIAAGDLLAIRTAGAYGAVMASEYNTRPLVPEVLVTGDRFAIVRTRPTVEAILAREPIPDWLR